MKSIKTLAVVTAAITLSACVSNPNTAVLTPLLGAAGGFAGSQFGQGKGRVIATGVGSLLGAFTGNHIGQTFDAVSHNTNAINRNARGIGELRLRPQMAPASVAYLAPVIYKEAPGQKPRLDCFVRNNYVVCND